jgi:hypothetical protein
MVNPQVEKAHYQFVTYVTKERWNSFWHQISELVSLNPEVVLEIGPGPGLFKALACQFGIKVETLDIDPLLSPDIVASATAIPCKDAKYDVACAFQVLEHFLYKDSLVVFEQMARVSKRYVLISLPDAKTIYRIAFQLPIFGLKQIFIPKPQLIAKRHRFNGQHYWEIGTRGYSLRKVIKDFEKVMKLVKTYRVPENSYHRFFLFEKINESRTDPER